MGTTPFPHSFKRELPAQDVYIVWDKLVRITHWVNALAVAVLLYTGLMIGGLVSRSPVDEPTFGFTMGNVRAWHSIAAYVFFANSIIRVYWLINGDTWGQWFRNQVWTRELWRELFWKIREYLSLRYTEHEAYTLGHNALASMAYVGIFGFGLILVLTGFAMKGQIDQGGIEQTLFGWVIPLLGSEATVRAVHRFSMWIMIAFIIHHVGIVLLLEVLGERGLISSIFSGLKVKPRGWHEEQPWRKPWAK